MILVVCRHHPPVFSSTEEMERHYWRQLTYSPALYGADICHSLYDEDQKIWDMKNLGTILDVVEQDSGLTIEGVNTPYLYFVGNSSNSMQPSRKSKQLYAA